MALGITLSNSVLKNFQDFIERDFLFFPPRPNKISNSFF